MASSENEMPPSDRTGDAGRKDERELPCDVRAAFRRPRSVSEVAEWDLNAKWFGVSPLVLMENAGAAVAQVVRERRPKARRIAVFAGSGGNGGDGLVAARHLSAWAEVDVYLCASPDRLRPEDVRVNWELVWNSPFVRTHVCPRAEDAREIARRLDAEEAYDVVVDALLGAGSRGEPREPVRTAIEVIREQRRRGAFVVSVDLPSGYPEARRVEADLAVTFAWDKDAYEKDPFPRVVVPIGYPLDVAFRAGPADVRALVAQPWTRKGERGSVFVLGGSARYPGAPLLAARAAHLLADLVTVSVFAEAPNFPVPHELIPLRLPGKRFTRDHLPALEEALRRAHAVVVGPGLGRHPETICALRRLWPLLAERGIPVVVDADALLAWSRPRSPGEASPKAHLRPFPAVLTPHAGEFRRLAALLGLPPQEDIAQGEGAFSAPPLVAEACTVIELARRARAVVLRKGPVDVVAASDRWAYNTTGDPGMTTAGTGDVLAGLVGGFLARGAAQGLLSTPGKDGEGLAFRAAKAAAFVNGLAGEIAAGERGGPWYTADDVLRSLPVALRRAAEFA
ncbi:NAD(P)H-hydrate dehydratase [Brockia lithotrophica]|uniref:Bifunctional NAD(P)H-hydrate repair enzyme n=1 Tax=Brockia lithotrophica TaxID=933949 RepID=A0A660LBF8_9BACL|nr:NAD(P)H-hydrate dehydratase [Brockia lithotrophica]RKQ88940.1 NAD(P)H-hydrate epimerase [Brockia lithotrophica]